MATVLIDADILVYQVSAAGEDVVNFDEDTVVAWADVEALTQVAVNSVGDIQRNTDCNNAVLCFSDRQNFRKKILTTYKANRSGNRKPIAYAGLKEKLKKCYETFEKPTLEGDDIIGILATHPSIIKGRKVIYSQDKDLLQIPGRHYNIKEKCFQEVTEEAANRHHYMQTLSGDRTDNYFGCPGIGPKKAEAVLDKTDEPWSAIVDTYQSAGLSEGDALIQAQVARICRSTDYNFKGGQVILWNP